jgi:hypothetical protein
MHPSAVSKESVPIPNTFLAILIVVVAEFFLTVVWGVQVAVDRARFKRHMPREDRARLSFRQALLGETVSGSEFEVGARFLQGGFIYATDRGFLRLEGDSLYFEGAKTSFSISKSRLSLRPLKSSYWATLLKNDLHPAVSVLSYSYEGADYRFGFVNVNRGLGLEGANEHARLDQWLSLPSEPAEFEVLMPKAIPPESASEALEGIKIPALAGQALLFLASMSLSVYLASLQVQAKWHGDSGLAPILWFICCFVGLEVALIGYFGVVLPIIRALRRYRFLSSHSD